MWSFKHRIPPEDCGMAWCREQLAKFQNGDICKLTEQVIFTDPYFSAPVNRHTSPQLDDLAARFQADVQAKVAATALKVSISPCFIPFPSMCHAHTAYKHTLAINVKVTFQTL